MFFYFFFFIVSLFRVTRATDPLNDKNQLLLTYKTFDNIFTNTKGLKMPSSILLKISNICLAIFERKFEDIKIEKKSHSTYKRCYQENC